MSAERQKTRVVPTETGEVTLDAYGVRQFSFLGGLAVRSDTIRSGLAPRAEQRLILAAVGLSVRESAEVIFLAEQTAKKKGPEAAAHLGARTTQHAITKIFAGRFFTIEKPIQHDILQPSTQKRLIFGLYAQGFRAAEIARKLGKSEHTLRQYRQDSYLYAHVHDSRSMVTAAIMSRQFVPDPSGLLLVRLKEAPGELWIQPDGDISLTRPAPEPDI